MEQSATSLSFFFSSLSFFFFEMGFHCVVQNDLEPTIRPWPACHSESPVLL